MSPATGEGLQSLRGSSGSLWCRHGQGRRFRPFNPSGVRLEVRRVRLLPRLPGPSIPQGFVWKPLYFDLLAVFDRPSIPQGFVWKGKSSMIFSTPILPFNPSGVRLEDKRLQQLEQDGAPSIPQGFVWKPKATAPCDERSLQSLRGSSGSGSKSARRATPASLQSLRGSSGSTPAAGAPRVGPRTFNPSGVRLEGR